MTVTLVPPDRETMDSIRSMALGTFLDGECYAFAIALNRALGWPIAGLMLDGQVRHAVVLMPDNTPFDARGPLSLDSLGVPFYMRQPYAFEIIEEDDLRAIRPIDDWSVARAGKFAEAIWPELPWKDGGRAGRVRRFAEGLEKLSREHGVWIRSMYPTTQPVVAIGYGDEAGYKVQSTGDGQFLLDRMLETEH